MDEVAAISVVTGATGHVGNTLVRELVRRGERVRAVVYGDQGAVLDGLPIERVHADTRDAAAVRAALRGATRVYHLAAVISIDAAGDRLVHAVNVEGTRNVVEACLTEGVGRLVHMSSVHALDVRGRRGAIDESCPLVKGPGALAYDRSKADGERVVLEAVARGLDAVIVSPGAVLGPNDFGPSLVAQGMLAMGKTPFVSEGAYNWVDVRDVVAGALAAAERGVRGQRYLLTGTSASVREVAELAARCSGRLRPRVSLPLWALWLMLPLVRLYARLVRARPPFTAHALRILASPCGFVNTRARAELGFAPRPLADTVRDAMRFYREAGYF
jgi:dihydroflavonol-4-reductase